MSWKAHFLLLLPSVLCFVALCRDVRAAVDLCHRDGSLKQAVAKDPAKYIHEDSRLIGIMDVYRAAGKKLFVATNSLWDYTHVVMNFLLTGRVGSDRNEDWLEYFDVVITGQAGSPVPLYLFVCGLCFTQWNSAQSKTKT